MRIKYYTTDREIENEEVRDDALRRMDPIETEKMLRGEAGMINIIPGGDGDLVQIITEEKIVAPYVSSDFYRGMENNMFPDAE